MLILLLVEEELFCWVVIVMFGVCVWLLLCLVFGLLILLMCVSDVSVWMLRLCYFLILMLIL